MFPNWGRGRPQKSSIATGLELPASQVVVLVKEVVVLHNLTENYYQSLTIFLQMSRWRATFQSTSGRVQQILPVGGEIQFTQRTCGLPP